MSSTSSALLEQAQAHFDNVENPHAVASDHIYGLWNVENTSDTDKPVSTAMQEGLDTKFNISDVYNKLTDDGSVEDLTAVPFSAAAGRALAETISGLSDIDATITNYEKRIATLEGWN